MESDIEAQLRHIFDGARPRDLEDVRLDFKEDARSPRETARLLADAAVCFANADGGTVVVGVNDDVSGPDALIGTELDPQEVQRRIYELTTPALLVQADELRFEDRRVLVLTVPRSFEIHADPQGRAKRRVGSACLPMSPQDQAALREERRGVDWSAEVSDVGMGDVDPDALSAARRRLRQYSDEVSKLADLSDADLLRGLGVVDERGRLLRGGEVLFCAGSGSTPWVLYQYRPTPGGEATLVERLAGPLLMVLDQLVELAWARRHVTSLNLPDGSQIEVADFPEGAVREVIGNALFHREFRLTAPVTIEHSPTVFVVESPGPLVAGVTEQNILTHPSKPRNPCLFQAARKLRLSEETGRGVDRMYRELLRSGHDTPSITQTTDTTRVAFVGGAPRTQVVKFIAGLDDVERDDVDTLLVIFSMLTSRTITAEELAGTIQKSETEAESVLSRLAADKPGILEATRESRRLKKSEYRLRSSALGTLGGAVAYRRRSVDDTDRKVIAHVNEYGRISNRTLQNLLDLDVFRARDLLRDLQQRQILVKTSEQQRGPAVEYGPGPKFPKQKRKGRNRRGDGGDQ
ncbi:MAG: putative DNA binding domain-containing protein [Acidimicrobiia bacterium]|nr:putative DNA binding domain-containing protein [Acidimicrobiia bacterium]